MKKKRLLILLIIIWVIFCFKNIVLKGKTPSINNIISTITDDTEYKIIKQDKNSNYSGIGQTKVENKDGYFTTFTTSETNKKTYLEYKQNGKTFWSDYKYWGGTMAENGCGITAISVILSGYNKGYTPEDLRKKYYPVLNADSISKELSKTFNIKNTDFYYDSIHLSKEKLQEHLKTNRPILICVWNKPNNNRWTTASHYMALLAVDDFDMVYISNPNGGENDSKSSGWYNFDEVEPYIAKALYIESFGYILEEGLCPLLYLYNSNIFAFNIIFDILLFCFKGTSHLLPTILLFIIYSFVGFPKAFFSCFCKSTLLVYIDIIFSLYITFIVVSVSPCIGSL